MKKIKVNAHIKWIDFAQTAQCGFQAVPVAVSLQVFTMTLLLCNNTYTYTCTIRLYVFFNVV